jgi:hypothetical protein
MPRCRYRWLRDHPPAPDGSHEEPIALIRPADVPRRSGHLAGAAPPNQIAMTGCRCVLSRAAQPKTSISPGNRDPGCCSRRGPPARGEEGLLQRPGPRGEHMASDERGVASPLGTVSVSEHSRRTPIDRRWCDMLFRTWRSERQRGRTSSDVARLVRSIQPGDSPCLAQCVISPVEAAIQAATDPYDGCVGRLCRFQRRYLSLLAAASCMSARSSTSCPSGSVVVGC